MVICIPSGITEVEKRAVFDSADHVDSKETYLIHEPMAAALGSVWMWKNRSATSSLILVVVLPRSL